MGSLCSGGIKREYEVRPQLFQSTGKMPEQVQELIRHNTAPEKFFAKPLDELLKMGLKGKLFKPETLQFSRVLEGEDLEYVFFFFLQSMFQGF